jgi:DNA processing protein
MLIVQDLPMNKAIQFKALQKRNKYRNPENILEITESTVFSKAELLLAVQYIDQLKTKGIRYTYPGDENYPMLFYTMIEPPLFFEFIGHTCWKQMDFLAVVGSRDCHSLTTDWINSQLIPFLKLDEIGLVSGGAVGVDLKSHVAALRSKRPTIVILPCGLAEIYPKDIQYLVAEIVNAGGAVISEFDYNQKIHKSFFFFRNRLIASLGRICLVLQASLKSGTMLTVHHALQNGRPVITIPSHPGLNEFKGNIKLINEGATSVTDCLSLYDFWKGESWSGWL